MRRPLLTACLSLSYLLVVAQVAMAESDVGHDGGEGWYGETNDKVVTNFGFALIAFFPLLIFTLSLLQWALDRRKDQRLAAARARQARVDLRGGW